MQVEWQTIADRLASLREWVLGPREIVRVEGACKMSGNCCRNLLLVDRGRPIASLRRFRRLAAREAEFEMFIPREGRSKDGLLRFSCRNLGDDGSCQIYQTRPDFCREYPTRAMYEVGGDLLPGCGYRFVVGDAPAEPFAEVFERALDSKPKVLATRSETPGVDSPI